MTKTLFQIAADAAALDELYEQYLIEHEGDVSDEEANAIFDEWLNENGEELEHKLDNCGALLAEWESKAAAREAEAKRLMALVQTDRNKAARLKERIKFLFEERGIQNIETPRYKFSLCNNGGKMPVILDEEIDATELPEAFQRVVVTPDIDSIRKALVCGEALRFARLGERGRHIRIR